MTTFCSPATLAKALAFVAITGNKTGLHMNTRISMSSDLCDLKPYTVQYGDGEPLTLHRYVVSEEGMKLARTSKLWKAHEALTAMGFRLERRASGRNYKPGYLSYRHPEHMERGSPRGAFISSGSAFAQREPGAEIPEGAKPWDYVKVAL